MGTVSDLSFFAVFVSVVKVIGNFFAFSLKLYFRLAGAFIQKNFMKENLSILGIKYARLSKILQKEIGDSFLRHSFKWAALFYLSSDFRARVPSMSISEGKKLKNN